MDENNQTTVNADPQPETGEGDRSSVADYPAPADVRQVDADATGDLLQDAESVQ